MGVTKRNRPVVAKRLRRLEVVRRSGALAGVGVVRVILKADQAGVPKRTKKGNRSQRSAARCALARFWPRSGVVIGREEEEAVGTVC